MIRSLIRIGLLLLFGILVYNYFFGTDVEKENSRKIFGQMKELATSAVELAKSEKEKFDAGKYDKVVSKLANVYKGLREKAQYLDEKVLSQLDDLESRKAQLQEEIRKIEADENAPASPSAPTKKGVKPNKKDEEIIAAKQADLDRRKKELQRQLDQLARETEKLAADAESKLK